MLRIAELSDIHWGHPNTPASHIMRGLYRDFADNSETAALDIIFFAGDIWDRLLNLPDDAVYDSMTFIVYLFKLAKKYNISVRALEGTPSHEWKQTRLFDFINKLIGELNSQPGGFVDFRYVADMEIEHIERFGIDVLYIPDEYKPTCEETWACVVEKLQEHKLEQVDYIVMHGQFPHQMPKSIHNQLQMHDPERYLSITRKYIFVGHIHRQSQYERILASGSYDRLSHGEEEPKGHYRLTIHDDGYDDIVFVENKTAQKYVTVNCQDLDEHRAKEKIERAAIRLPKGSFIRIKCKRHDAAMSLIDSFQNQFYDLQWSSVETGKPSKADAPILTDNRSELKVVQITRDNIAGRLLGRVAAKHPKLVPRCTERLMETIDE